MEEFFTLTEITTSEQVIEKSRFIAVAVPLTSPEQIEKARQEIRANYPNARHYVYAYRLHDGLREKASDDGEPQGTGGRPILDILQRRNVWNVLVVVVRYFGGVLLGTGGLTRAYGGAARQVITEAELKKLTLYSMWRLDVPYEWFAPLKYQITQRQWLIKEEEFGEDVKFIILVPEEDEEPFKKWLDDFTGQKAHCEYLCVVWA